MNSVVDKGHMDIANKFRRVLSDYAKIEDLVNLGAYERGNNKNTDYALNMIDKLNGFLQQDLNSPSSMKEALQTMSGLFAGG